MRKVNEAIIDWQLQNNVKDMKWNFEHLERDKGKEIKKFVEVDIQHVLDGQIEWGERSSMIWPLGEEQSNEWDSNLKRLFDKMFIALELGISWVINVHAVFTWCDPMVRVLLKLVDWIARPYIGCPFGIQ